MSSALRYYSLPLALALGIHALAVLGLYSNWKPDQQEVRAIKPQIVHSQLIVLEPKPKPQPVSKPKPVAAKPAPVVEKPKPAPEPKPVAAQPKVDQALAEAQRIEAQQRKEEAERLQRLAALADASFDQILDEETAQLEVSNDQAMAASYQAGIYQLVKANWSRPPSARNGMQAKVEVELIPTGDVVSVTIVQSSGNAAFDRSAESAVRKARRFVVPEDSSVFERHFRRFSLLFRPEDLLR
ncbi:MAG: cell envelope integrity protein TolA [Proteobacteria bacterium]|nr:cell envelope integrity protein TolA [Pseudomonadota bacterium]